MRWLIGFLVFLLSFSLVSSFELDLYPDVANVHVGEEVRLASFITLNQNDSNVPIKRMGFYIFEKDNFAADTTFHLNGSNGSRLVEKCLIDMSGNISEGCRGVKVIHPSPYNLTFSQGSGQLQHNGVTYLFNSTQGINSNIETKTVMDFDFLATLDNVNTTRHYEIYLVAIVGDSNKEDLFYSVPGQLTITFNKYEDLFNLILIKPTNGTNLNVEENNFLDVGFEIHTDEDLLAARGYNLTMDYCTIREHDLLNNQIKDHVFSNLSFVNFTLVSMDAGNYKVQAFCRNHEMYALSEINSLDIISFSTTFEQETLRDRGGGRCRTSWTCTEWSECIDGERTRECEKERDYCVALPLIPTESQSCENIVPLSAPNVEEEPFFSFITGALIGAPSGVKMFGAFLFLVLLIMGAIIVQSRKLLKAAQ